MLLIRTKYLIVGASGRNEIIRLAGEEEGRVEDSGPHREEKESVSPRSEINRGVEPGDYRPSPSTAVT